MWKILRGYNFNIYLAGPDVFRAEQKVKEVSKALKDIASHYHQHGHFPLDNALMPSNGDYKSQAFSQQIFSANVELMNDADVIIANVQPYRGPNMDDGTAFAGCVEVPDASVLRFNGNQFVNEGSFVNNSPFFII